MLAADQYFDPQIAFWNQTEVFLKSRHKNSKHTLC